MYQRSEQYEPGEGEGEAFSDGDCYGGEGEDWGQCEGEGGEDYDDPGEGEGPGSEGEIGGGVSSPATDRRIDDARGWWGPASRVDQRSLRDGECRVTGECIATPERDELRLPDFRQHFPELFRQLEILMKQRATRGDVNAVLDGALWPDYEIPAKVAKKAETNCHPPISGPMGEFRERYGRFPGEFADNVLRWLDLHLDEKGRYQLNRMKKGGEDHRLGNEIGNVYSALELYAAACEEGDVLRNPHASFEQCQRGIDLESRSMALLRRLGEYATELEVQLRRRGRAVELGTELTPNAQTFEALAARVRSSSPAAVIGQFMEEAAGAREGHLLAERSTPDQETDANFVAAGLTQGQQQD